MAVTTTCKQEVIAAADALMARTGRGEFGLGTPCGLSLARGCILFLDEMTEFSQTVLEETCSESRSRMGTVA